MRAMFAEAIGGMLVTVALMFAGLASSGLGLVALGPAARGDRSATLKLIAAPVILGLVNLCVWGYGLAELLSDGHSEMIAGYLSPWLIFIAAPLATSLFAVITLCRRR